MSNKYNVLKKVSLGFSALLLIALVVLVSTT